MHNVCKNQEKNEKSCQQSYPHVKKRILKVFLLMHQVIHIIHIFFQKKKGLKFRIAKRLFCEVVPNVGKMIEIAFLNNYLKILIVMRKIQKTLIRDRGYGII